LPLGWVILPFQGVNGIFLFFTQGVAIGLGYIALSGRGNPNMNFFALKGQHTLAQRTALGYK